MKLLLVAGVWVHLVAVIIWIGGMLTLALVIIPTTRDPELRALGARFLSPIALRFRQVAWASLLVLVATGVVNTLVRGIGPAEVFNLTILESAYGRTLALKAVLVALALVLSYVHDFRLGPRLSALQRTRAAEEATAPLRRRVLLLARLNVLLALAIVLLAAALPRGGLL